MKMLVTYGVATHIEEDSVILNVTETGTEVGDPVEVILGYANAENTVLYENITPPEGWLPNKYTFDGSAFYINDDNPEAKANRLERNTLLTETDWWCLSDQTPTQAQLDYRQALRDITGHANWPNLTDADWPVKPA